MHPITFSTPPSPLFSLSPHSTGPNLKLSGGPSLAPRTLTNTENKRWSAARALHPFKDSCHHWTVRIDKCVSKNIFIGVCTSDSALGNYVGSDQYSWGYLANRAIWHNKSKVRAYGEQFKEGDLVGAKLDLRPGMGGTLSFSRNGRSLGVAVEGLEGPLYPAFSMYNKEDSISLVDCREEEEGWGRERGGRGTSEGVEVAKTVAEVSTRICNRLVKRVVEKSHVLDTNEPF